GCPAAGFRADRRWHPHRPDLHRPPRPAGRRGAGAAGTASARARRTHRHLRRARRGLAAGQRRTQPPPRARPLRRPARRAAGRPRRSQTMSPSDTDALRATLDDAWERRADLTADDITARVRPAVDRAIAGLESGELRVAEPDGDGGWRVNQWLKKAVLLYFRTQDMALVDAAPAPFWDKVPARFAGFD